MRIGIASVFLTIVVGIVWSNLPGQASPPVSSPAPQLSSDIPHDVLEKLGPGYSDLASSTQAAFDLFSWQSFVALNWPADIFGRPLRDSILTHPGSPRVWEFYRTPQDVFDPTSQNPAGQNQPAAGTRLFSIMTSPMKRLPNRPLDDSFLESTEYPLIDRNLNFVMYDIVLNDVEYQYIKSNGLDTAAGQKAFMENGNTVSFPLGFYANPTKMTGGSVGAVEIKTSWRILDPRTDDLTRFYTVRGKIYVDPQHSANGKALYIQATMGLVGMHIMQRVTGPYSTFDGKPTGKQCWIWSTFEHIDNAPDATNAREADDISLPLPATADAPQSVSKTYSFFNPKYTGPTNAPPALKPGEANYLWNPKPPYAARYANEGKYGTQVVRAWKIFPETGALNTTYQGLLAGQSTSAYFRGLLKGTVWANYELVGTQWMGGVESPSTENGNIPRYLSNTTLETYIQFISLQGEPMQTVCQFPFPPGFLPEGSCMSCHGCAQTTAGQDANFSFLLGRAK